MIARDHGLRCATGGLPTTNAANAGGFGYTFLLFAVCPPFLHPYGSHSCARMRTQAGTTRCQEGT